MKSTKQFPNFVAALYGLLMYLSSIVALLYFIGFVENVAVPKSIDYSSTDGTDTATAAMIDFLLIGMFGLQHSVMARPAFKAIWTKIVPASVERSTYIAFSSAALGALAWLWQPIKPLVWEMGPQASVVVLGVSYLGWAVMLLSTFLINHFELFGLRQSFARMFSYGNAESSFRTPFLYRVVRHPLYLGLLLAFWAAPKMSVGHLLFSLVMTMYVVYAITLEETDLIAQFGGKYLEYRGRVGMLIPRFRSKA